MLNDGAGVTLSGDEPVFQDTPSAIAATPLKEGNNRMRQAALMKLS